jgi:hypothetical protein
MKGGHEPLSLESAFAFHRRFQETGTMRDPSRIPTLAEY